jgi:hypothetical protein
MCFVNDGQTYQVGCFFLCSGWDTMQAGCGIFVGVGVAFGTIQIKGHKIVKVS